MGKIHMIHPDAQIVMWQKSLAFPVCAADLPESTIQLYLTGQTLLCYFLHMRKVYLKNSCLHISINPITLVLMLLSWHILKREKKVPKVKYLFFLNPLCRLIRLSGASLQNGIWTHHHLSLYSILVELLKCEIIQCFLFMLLSD